MKSEALRRNLLVAALCSVFCLLAATSPRAQAASILINNGLAPPNPGNVIDDGTYATDSVYVRNVGCPPAGESISSPCPSPGGPTGVSVIRGQSLISTLTLRTYETSTATIDGARLGGLYALDFSDVTINDGSVGGGVGIRASGSASVTVLGGNVAALNPSRVGDISVITLSGGSVRDLTAGNSSSAILAGGTVSGLLLAEDSSSVVLNAGSISTLSLVDSSSLVMSGGEVSDALRVNDSGHADISGGTIHSLYLSTHSPASITGGVISDLEIVGGGPVGIVGGAIGVLTNFDATATLMGGTMNEMNVLTNHSTLLIEGSGFAVDGIPVPYGDLAAVTGTLTGTLASGDWINSAFTRELLTERGTITLVPVPECSDGLDNDGDTLIDYPDDPGCFNPRSEIEDTTCQDGDDNDSDGRIDFDGGASAGLPPADQTDPDPWCVYAWQVQEEGCGLGVELALLLPPLMSRWRRRSLH